MIKEFKQIDMTVGETVTRDFKRGFTLAREHKVKEITFTWGAKMRLSDAEFTARLLRVLPNFTTVDVSTMKQKPVEHGVMLFSETGF